MNTLATDEIWRFALAAIPLAVIVAVVCRCLPCRPSTRHTLWLTLLGLFLIAPLLPQAPVPDLASWLEPEKGGEAVLPPLAAAVEEPDKTGKMKKDPPPAPPTERAGDPSARTAISRALHPLSDAWRPFMIRPAAAEPAPAPTAVAAITGSSDRPSGPEPDGGGPPAHRSGELHPRQFATTQSAPNEDAARLRLPFPHKRDADGGPPAEIPPTPLAEGLRAAVAEPGLRPDSDRPGTVWAQWLVHLRTIRDAVMDLPPIPTPVWAGGAALLMLVTAARALRFRSLLKSAEPPSPVTVRHVAQAAASLGLRRAPQTLMVNQRISPMVWCGRRLCLLLPNGLWQDLDEAGRRAVVHHELAHLRRRDHWVCYLAMIVGWLYWWHPVVWWVRRQLREEADLCCDVWVTSLMPGARRAYATALLETKKYTCGFRPAAPATGLGVSTTRAKRFARRLTMVMSHQLTPKLTYGGIVLACALAAGSWLAAPTLACPPKDKDAAKASKAAECTAAAEAAVKALEAIKIAEPAVIAVAMPGPPDPAQRAESTFEQYLKYGDADVLKQMGLDERMARLEKQLDALMRKLGQWGEHLDIDLSGIEIGALPELAEIREMPQFADLPKDVTKILESKLGPTYQKALGSYMAMAGPPPVPQQQETIARCFKLPEGKLEALTELMVRADVPVLVSPGEGCIQVHGTPQQQIIFEAFCLMIDGEDQVKQYPLSAGKLEALSKLMVRPDVPILVSPGEKGIEVNGTDLEQHVFEAFMKMIEPGEAAKGKVKGGTYVPAPAPPKAPKAMKAPKPPKAPKAMKAPKPPKAPKAREYERKAVAQVQELHKLSAMLKSLEKQAGSLEMKSEQVWRKAEELERKAEQLEEQADEIEDSADDLKGEARLKAIQHANELMIKAQQLENESRLLEAKAEALEEQAEALEEKAEDIEERIEEIQEAAGSHDDDDDDEDDDC